METLQIIVQLPESGPMRLDKYCASLPRSISRSRLKNGIKEILVNGSPSKLSRTVRAGDRVTIHWEDPEPADILAEEIPLDIVYEDSQVTVINKSQGMVTHPAAGNWSGTLVHALLFHWKKNASDTNPRPGIVHRLDKDTSGIIITARNPTAETWLQEQFRTRKTIKVYAAILCGIPYALRGDIKNQIMRDPKNRKRYVCTETLGSGRFAHTSYRVIRVYGKYSLVLFKLHTGRTHQLRVHSRFIGCPILGDPIYGKKDSLFPDATLMLHARSLDICLPENEVPAHFEVPVPARFKLILQTLKERFP